ncbi:MAG: LysR family transcriptional regulator [Clostridiales bacterium]|nr:LysR family transcriptional regulator [Clostridiales bacterium]
MGIEKYRTFVVAADYNTFYEAAEAMNITAATVSKHIAALEKELGIILFDRLPYGVRLTKEGNVRRAAAQKLVSTYDALITKPAIPAGKKLIIYSTPPPSRFGLTRILKEFAVDFPDVDVEVIEKRDAVKAIEEEECEIGFIGSKHQLPEKIQFFNIKNTRIGAILPDNHPLARREVISLSELRDEKFVFPGPEVGVHHVYMDCCKNHGGFVPKIKQTAHRDDSVLFFVANQDMVSLFTMEMMSLYNYKGVKFVPLEEELYTGGALAKIKDRPLSATAADFWDFMRRHYKL